MKNIIRIIKGFFKKPLRNEYGLKSYCIQCNKEHEDSEMMNIRVLDKKSKFFIYRCKSCVDIILEKGITIEVLL